LNKMAVFLALALLAFGLAGLCAESDGLALTTEECHALVGGGTGGPPPVTTGPCCNGTSGTRCNDNVLCLDSCYACTGTDTGIKPCNNNGTRCNSGFCDNGIGGCANHQCPYNQLC
jgi:hypothetical protein